jgi:hypothetical protein
VSSVRLVGIAVLIQSDYDESNEARCSMHEQCGRSSWCNLASGRCEDEACGGFYLLRAGAPSIALLEALFQRMAWQRKNIDERLGEQPALNYVLRRTHGVRYELLPREEYPNGNAYFLRKVWPRAPRLPTIVHNNWLAGYAEKRVRFERHGMWFATDSGTCIDAAIGAPHEAREDAVQM